jgi:inorganic pyrophosphatase
MTKHDLTKLPAFYKNDWHAVIETPKDSHHKYDYEPEFHCFVLKKTLPQGMSFPLDFGFIPSTLGDDGDPLDILIVLDFPGSMGALVQVRLIGCIQAEQKEKESDWKRNDRFVAVCSHSSTLADVKSFKDLRPKQLDELIAFFEEYNRLEDRKFRSIGTCGERQAEDLIRQGIKMAKKQK